MKILKTCLSKSWGGLEMVTLQTVKQLLSRGIDTELLCYPNSRIYEEAINNGIKVNTSKFTGYFHPLEILETIKLFSAKRYDIIHCGSSKDLWLIVPVLKFIDNHTPLLLSKHMGSFIIKKDFLHKWIYERVTYALAISNVIAKNLTDTTTLTADKVLLLHNGIDTNKYDPSKVCRSLVRNEFKISDDDILIGMLARFSPGKGHEEFLQAAKQLNGKFSNLKFIIIGGPSKDENEYEMEIRKLAFKLNVDRNTIFTGYRKDIPEILAAIDIFAFPSHAEAFGVSLVEAMSMEKPSVCSNSDGILDIAVDGVTSYLFEKQNWKDLSDKIELLIKSPETRINFGKEGRRRAQELFDIEVFTDKLINIYKSTMI